MTTSAAGHLSTAINARGPLRAIVKSGLGQHAIQTGRAVRLVERPVGFAVSQATRRHRRYQLRNGLAVMVRHRTRDVPILVEIFSRGTYEPPPGVDLAGPLRVLDCGGNVGLFGAYALGRWDVGQLVSFEPDPMNYQLLEVVARRARWTRDARWMTERAAVGNHEGTMRFLAGHHSESREARAGEPSITVRLVDVFDRAPCDLLKIDIEGGEWPILTDPRLAGFARVIVLEWHAHECPEPDALGMAQRLLRDAGYVRQRETHEHDGNGILWGWR